MRLMGNLRAADGTVDIYCACHEKLVVVHVDGTLDFCAPVRWLFVSQTTKAIVVCRKCGERTDVCGEIA